MEKTYQEEIQPKKDSNKIYFLIAVLIALLGSNAYFIFKDQKSSDKIVTLDSEKSRMGVEIDKIEAELDKANESNVQLTADMKEEQDLARQKITELREQLRTGKLTASQLAKAQKELKDLRFFVTKYTADIAELQKQNQELTVERDSLRTSVSNISDRATKLEAQNTELNSKVKVGAALKTGAIDILPLRIKNSGKETDVTRASSAKKIRITFNVVSNSLAEKGMHDVFIRIIDPNGNLITNDNSSMFNADGEDLQYTYRTAIDYDNTEKVFNVDWTNPGNFVKGTYTVMLYADGYTMGKSSFSLR